MDLFDGDHCAAALIGMFEFMTNWEIARRDMAEEPGEPWVRASMARIEDDMMGHYGHTSIQSRIDWMVASGVLQQKQSKLGEVKHYLLEVDIVNDLLQRRCVIAKIGDDSIAKIGDENCLSSPPSSPKKSDDDEGLNLKVLSSISNKKTTNTSSGFPCEKQDHTATSKPLPEVSEAPPSEVIPPPAAADSTTAEVERLRAELARSQALMERSEELASELSGEVERPQGRRWSRGRKEPKRRGLIATVQEQVAMSVKVPEFASSGGAGSIAAPEPIPQDPPTQPAPSQPPPIDFPERWNQLVPSCPVIWNTVYDHAAAARLRELSNSPDFVSGFDALCRKAEAIHKARGDDAGWLTFKWILGQKNGGPANWWKVASGELNYMTRPMSTSGHGSQSHQSQVAACLDQLKAKYSKYWKDDKRAS